MSNMSYCRFQNTHNDFADCKNALQGIIEGVDGDGETPKPLSRGELEAAQLLIADAVELVKALMEATGCEIEEATGCEIDEPNLAGMLCDYLKTRNAALKGE